MRWFWSVTCISLGIRWHCNINFKCWLISVSEFMFMSVCVWYIYIFVCVSVCLELCVNSSSLPWTVKVSPDRHHFHITEWASFFFPLTYIYRQKTKASSTVCSLSICLSLTLEREEEEEPKWKCTQTYSEIHRLSGSCFKLCFLHWQKKEGSIILASMLWSQNTDTFILLFVFTYVFIYLFVLEISPSHFTLWPRVCVPVQKKGRFVVVLSSHLRCSPFKRHRFSYKLCDCEWVGRGIWEGRMPPVPPHPPRTPFTPSEYVPSPLLRACSAAQLLQHFPLAKIVLFNEHAETAFCPRFFICFP